MTRPKHPPKLLQLPEANGVSHVRFGFSDAKGRGLGVRVVWSPLGRDEILAFDTRGGKRFGRYVRAFAPTPDVLLSINREIALRYRTHAKRLGLAL